MVALIRKKPTDIKSHGRTYYLCTKCGLTIDSSNFYKHFKLCDGVPYPNKVIRAANRRLNDPIHAKYLYEQARKAKVPRRQRNQEFVNAYKEEHGCYVCEERCYSIIDTHHLDPTEKCHDVSDLVGKGRSLEVIKKELKKCVCLCKNCHGKEQRGLISLLNPIGVIITLNNPFGIVRYKSVG